MILEPLNVLLILLLAWSLIYLLSRFLHLEGKGVDATPLYLTYKTDRLNEFLKGAAAKNPRFWRVASNVGVALAVGEISLSFYILGSNLLNFFYAPQEAQAVFPLLPGITISLQWFPYLLIAMSLAVTIHELAHGVVASREGITIKSAGIVIAPITAGGFVEPDEEEFEESGLIEKLRFLAAGSMTNMTVGLFVTLIATALFIPASGVLVMAVTENGPAKEAGLEPWEVIHSINGTGIVDLISLSEFMKDVKPGDLLIVETNRAPRVFRAGASSTNASRAIMGVYNLVSYLSLRLGETSPRLTYQLNLTLYWLSLIMINLAIFNMLPLYPLDGEAYIYSIIKERVEKNLKAVRIGLSSVSLSLLALNILLTFINYGLTPI